MSELHELPEHVQRIIRRDDDIEFTPPSFERWLGRLQMMRTLASMGAFLLVWLTSYTNGMSWDQATIRGIVAALAFHFFAWAAGLFIFGELYTAEVKRARHDLEERERDRARRIEDYYRERLRAQQAEASADSQIASVGPVPALPGQTAPMPVSSAMNTAPFPTADAA